MTAEQPDAPPHGTLRGYSMGCRCILCKAAKSATVPESTGEIPQSDERTTTTG